VNYGTEYCEGRGDNCGSIILIAFKRKDNSEDVVKKSENLVVVSRDRIRGSESFF
jgi:hypothetical protein